MRLVQEAFNKTLNINGNISGLSEGLYRFGFHEFGSTKYDCSDAGGHFKHNELDDFILGTNKTNSIDLVSETFSLFGPHSIMGGTIVFHTFKQGMDDRFLLIN